MPIVPTCPQLAHLDEAVSPAGMAGVCAKSADPDRPMAEHILEARLAFGMTRHKTVCVCPCALIARTSDPTFMTCGLLWELMTQCPSKSKVSA